MSGTQMQAGSLNTDFLKGLDLIIDSLMDKNSSNDDGQTVEKGLPLLPILGAVGLGAAAGVAGAGKIIGGLVDASDDGEPQGEEGNAVEKVGPLAAIGSGVAGGVKNVGKKIIGDLVDSSDDGEKGGEVEKVGPLVAAGLGAVAGEVLGGGDEEKSHVKDATDLGDKTNLPPEMGRRDKGSSIAEPMLRRREVRKATLNSMQRGIDLLKMMATVDKTIEKFDGTKDRISDIQLLKAFGLCECTKTEDIKEGTLIHKMLTDRGSRPSDGWWEECISFAKSFEGMEEPAFFATFLYYEPDKFIPDSFMKGLNDTGGQVKHGRAMSRDTEIDENIGAIGGGAIDGLGMSDDEDDDTDVEKEHHGHKT